MQNKKLVKAPTVIVIDDIRPFPNKQLTVKPVVVKGTSLVTPKRHTCTCNCSYNSKHVMFDLKAKKKNIKKAKRCYNCGSTDHLVKKCKLFNFDSPKVRKRSPSPSGPILRWVPKKI